MSKMCQIRRIQSDLKYLQENPLQYCTGGPVGDNLFKWLIIIDGPQHSPYEGGKYKLAIDLLYYPLKAPIVVFQTQIFHPNVGNDGYICLEMVQENWSPIIKIQQVLMEIYSMLNDPNPERFLNAEATRLFMESKEEFIQTVRQHVRLYASK
ncbi:Ubiquitin-conjugating_enzyme E2 [Hexamita inflata]|uniref:Ubiquitin-conjugating enzyme E2 n=1 Tax=Hexamita inflata TaxID=28002 RepID=A0AA86PYF5_9EUKA|nr:Ubiquitin-conjugating enzyme E2 [Hexamita inflata]